MVSPHEATRSWLGKDAPQQRLLGVACSNRGNDPTEYHTAFPAADRGSRTPRPHGRKHEGQDSPTGLTSRSLSVPLCCQLLQGPLAT